MRDTRGKFTKGTAGGPGRPKKSPPPTSPPITDLGDAAALILEVHARRDVDRAWQHLLDTMPRRDVQILAESNRQRGKYVPDWPDLQLPAV